MAELTPDPSALRLEQVPEAVVLGLVGAACLVYRIVTNTEDVGGTFFLCWFTMAGIVGCATLARNLVGPRRAGLRVSVVLIAALQVGTNAFAPQALLPFALLTALLVVALTLPARGALCLLLLGVVLIPYLRYGARQVATITAVRTLRPGDVASIELEGATRQVIDAPERVAVVVEALRHTVPYSPNHQSPTSPLEATVVLRDGARLSFTLSLNSHWDHHSVWVRIGVSTYSNPALLGALRRLQVKTGW